MTGFIVVAVLAAALAFGVAVIYNRLVRLRNRFKNAFAQIDVQLTRRHDLIPNLVNAAGAYLKHERETLEAVTRARSAAGRAKEQAAEAPDNGSAIAKLAAAEGALTGALGRLFALREDYPELRASENIQQLQEELATTENRIAFARQAFNDAVMRYNTFRESFPQVILASSLGFELATPFEAPEDHREVPTVAFD